MGNSCLSKKSMTVISSKVPNPDMKVQISENSLPEPFYSSRQILWKPGDLISEGKISKVYQCINMKTGELLILKSYPASKTANNTQELKKIKKEIKILKSIEHKNILKLYQTENSSDAIELVMEYIPSGCLEEILLKYGPLEEEIVKNYLKQIIEVTSYLNSMGITHNNIKSDSIYVTSEGVLKISGFKNFTTNSQEETDLIYKKVLYLHQYLAPEVLNGESSPSSDSWSIGCLAINLLTAKDPFYYLSSDSGQVLKTLGSGEFNIIFPKASNRLKSFIGTCLKVDSATRPPTKELLKHEIFSNKKTFFDFPSDESLRVSLSKTTDYHHAIAESENE
jgi:serine/threonine protein kinase